MFRHSLARYAFITKITKVSKPPVSGYELAELPNEKVLREFMQFYKSKGILVVLHSGDISAPGASPLSIARSSAVRGAVDKSTPGGEYSIVQDSVTRSFISSINAMNMGNPDEMKIALVPGAMAPRLVDEYNVLTYPTTLLFLEGKCMYRCVGARTRELSIKSLFMLRNNGRNIFSRE